MEIELKCDQKNNTKGLSYIINNQYSFIEHKF